MRIDKNWLLLFWLPWSPAIAELSLESSFPTQGEIHVDQAVEVTGSGFAQDLHLTMHLDVSNARLKKGLLRVEGEVSGLQVADGKVYVSGGLDDCPPESGDYLTPYTTLWVVDVSDPTDPQMQASGNYSTACFGVPGEDLAVVGDTVLIAHASGDVLHGRGVTQFDVTGDGTPILRYQPGSPQDPLRGSATAVAIEGDQLFVTKDSHLEIFDVSAEAAPVHRGSLETPGEALEIVVEEGIAYIADGSTGLTLVDVRLPEAPAIIGRYQTAAPAIEVDVREGTVLVAQGEFVLVIDASDPGDLNLVGSYHARDQVQCVAYAGPYAYFCQEFGIGRAVQTESGELEYEGSVATTGRARGIDFLGDWAFVVSRDSAGEWVLESIETAPRWAVAGVQVELGKTYEAVRGALTLAGDLAYVVDGSSSFSVVDLSDPLHPEIIASAAVPGTISAVDVVDDKAYVASYLFEDTTGTQAGPSWNTWTWLSILDLSVRGSISVVDSFDGFDVDGAKVGGSRDAGIVLRIRVRDGLAHILRHTSYWLVDLDSRRKIGATAVTSPARDFVLLDARALVYYSNVLDTLDLEDVTNPQFVARTLPGINFQVPARLELDGTKAILVSSAGDTRAYDVTDPLLPVETGLTLPRVQPGAATGKWVGDALYLYDSAGIHQYDVAGPSPILRASVDISGVAVDLAVRDDRLFIHDGSSLRIIQAPIKINPQLVDSNHLNVTLPGPSVPGEYTLTAYLGDSIARLDGAITFEPPSGTRKAIIVAGGGPYAGNNLWGATRASANFAYRALRFQGYSPDRIHYLSPELTTDVYGDGVQHVDDDVTLTTVRHAIREWANDAADPASELLLYVVDHGGDSKFRLNLTQELRADTLDGWLDETQLDLPGRLVVVYDACQSGTFIPKLRPPAGKERILVTSAGNENAIFANNGGLSFSFQFWASVLSGGDLYQSFLFGKRMMRDHQEAQLDADGNGIANEKEDTRRASNLPVGRGFVPASDKPFISTVSHPQIISGTASAELTASGIVDVTGIERVWGVIVPPDFNPGSPDIPVLNLPVVELGDDDGDGTWRGTYDEFDREGIYKLTIYAINQNGFYSQPSEAFPNSTTVTQLGGINQPPELALLGRYSMEVALGQAYEEPGFVADDQEDGDLTAEVQVTGSVDSNAEGTYIVTYAVTDAAGKTTRAERFVFVVSNTAPVLTLIGETTVNLPQGRVYLERGFIAEDSQDGNLTEDVIVLGTVDASTPGSYTLVYTVVDSNGRVATTQRTVWVFRDAAPALALGGPEVVTLQKGESYVEPGFVAADEEDGDLRESVRVFGAVDPDTPGTYPVVYAVSDSSGQTSVLSRLVKVEEGSRSSRLINISTRALVDTGDEVMIAGFVIGGDQPKTVVVRAVGPSLELHGVAGALADPELALYSGPDVIAANGDWETTERQGELPDYLVPLDSRESVLIIDLMPGAYTAIVRGTGGTTGVALVEAYEVD